MNIQINIREYARIFKWIFFEYLYEYSVFEYSFSEKYIHEYHEYSWYSWIFTIFTNIMNIHDIHEYSRYSWRSDPQMCFVFKRRTATQTVNFFKKMLIRLFATEILCPEVTGMRVVSAPQISFLIFCFCTGCAWFCGQPHCFFRIWKRKSVSHLKPHSLDSKTTKNNFACWLLRWCFAGVRLFKIILLKIHVILKFIQNLF